MPNKTENSIRNAVVNPSKRHINAELDTTGLRLSLFRLYAEPKFESELIKIFEERLKGKVAFFKIFGAYDIACIYPSYSDHRMLFSGSIKGISSFSNLDCLCWGHSAHENILSRLKENNLLAIISCSINPVNLAQDGGVRFNPLAALTNANVSYLNTFSFGEQVIFLTYASLEPIVDKCKLLNIELEKHSSSLQTYFGINYDLIKEIDQKGPTAWNEKVDDKLSIYWEVELVCKQDVFSIFLHKVRELHVNNDYKFHILNINKSLSGTIVKCQFRNGTWGEVTHAIRKIRENTKDIIISTRLNLYTNHSITR